MERGRALVVLSHGFLGGRVQFLPMASVLSRQHDVLNYGYRSRKDTVQGHAQRLFDNIAERVQAETRRQNQRTAIHFVTHSFGGVVLHRAFADGLAEVLPNRGFDTRCVMLGPPLRGASLARRFQKERMLGPAFVRNFVHGTAVRVMGQHCGAQLLQNDPTWFTSEIGVIPDQITVLVIAGQRETFNPLINEASDGIVTVQETVMNRNHFRLHVNLTHNWMLCSQNVINSVSSFIDGESVGKLVEPDPESGIYKST